MASTNLHPLPASGTRAFDELNNASSDLIVVDTFIQAADQFLEKANAPAVGCNNPTEDARTMLDEARERLAAAKLRVDQAIEVQAGQS